MTKKPLESVNEKHLIKMCKTHHLLLYKFTTPGITGVPDRLIIYRGHHIFIELKRPGEKPRPRQIEVHKIMRAQGAEVHTIDNKEDIDSLIEEILSRPPLGRN